MTPFEIVIESKNKNNGWLSMVSSAIGIEDYTDEQVNDLIISTGYYKPKRNFHEPEMMIFTDDNDNEFFSVNIAVGYEDEIFIEGGTIFPFSILNEINSTTDETEEN